ncbi:MAG: glycosyltransferase family 4 protein [Candidatus Peribacteraceae bacterium]|nr:glycosyltransferase family 4 protein [Candidatus Peribacteraceae bacterium]
MKSRIVILSAFLSPLRSGAEACAEEVPLALHNRYDFVIVTARMRRSLPRRDLLSGKIPIIRVGLGLSIDKWLYPFLAPFAARSQKPDIIHAILETFAGAALLLCRWIVPGVKRILTLQTTNRSFLKGPIIRSPDHVTAISGALISIAEGLGRKDVTKIPNGIPLALIEDAMKRNTKVQGRILFVGRLEKMKGVDTLLRAFAQLNVDNARLHIVGDGSQRDALEQLSQQLKIADRVTFTGAIPSPRVYDEFAQAEIFCGLSRSEALGNVFLEAQAAGCVVVATRVGGIPDIMKYGICVLITPDDPKEAAEAIEKLFANKGWRQSFTDAVQEDISPYDWSVIAERYTALYDAV